MNYADFNSFCGSLPATTHVIQWGNAHVWKVGGKVFAIGGWEKTGQPAYTFKASDLNFDYLRNEPGYRPAPYFATRGMKWIQQYDIPGASEQLKYYLRESHRLAAKGLTRQKQQELGLDPRVSTESKP